MPTPLNFRPSRYGSLPLDNGTYPDMVNSVPDFGASVPDNPAPQDDTFGSYQPIPPASMPPPPPPDPGSTSSGPGAYLGSPQPPAPVPPPAKKTWTGVKNNDGMMPPPSPAPYSPNPLPPLTDPASQAPGRPSPLTNLGPAPTPPTPSKPNMWQRIAAGAMGGLAGYVNASGKRMNPIDASGAEQAILHPHDAAAQAQYQRAKSMWDQQRADLTAQQAAELQQENINSLVAARQALSDQRKSDAETRAQTQKERQFEADSRILQNGGIKQKASDPVLPGYTVLQSPFDPNIVYAIPPAPKAQMYKVGPRMAEILDIPENTQVPEDVWKIGVGALARIADARSTVKNQFTGDLRASLIATGAKDPDNPTQAEAKAAQEYQEQNKVRVALASRPPREPSASQLNYNEREAIAQAAQRIMNDTREQNPKADYDEFIKNAGTYYQNDPVVSKYRDQIIKYMYGLKRGTIMPKTNGGLGEGLMSGTGDGTAVTPVSPATSTPTPSAQPSAASTTPVAAYPRGGQAFPPAGASPALANTATAAIPPTMTVVPAHAAPASPAAPAPPNKNISMHVVRAVSNEYNQKHPGKPMSLEAMKRKLSGSGYTIIGE